MSSPKFDRSIRLSRTVAAALMAAAAIYLAGQFLAFLDPPVWGQLGALDLHHTGIDLSSGLPLTGRIEALALDLVPAALACWALIELARLFLAQGRGTTLDLSVGRHLRRSAYLLVAYEAISLIFEGPISLLLTAYRGPLRREFNLSFTAYDFGVLLVAGALFAIGSLLAEAGRAADENAGFV